MASSSARPSLLGGSVSVAEVEVRVETFYAKHSAVALAQSLPRKQVGPAWGPRNISTELVESKTGCRLRANDFDSRPRAFATSPVTTLHGLGEVRSERRRSFISQTVSSPSSSSRPPTTWPVHFRSETLTSHQLGASNDPGADGRSAGPRLPVARWRHRGALEPVPSAHAPSGQLMMSTSHHFGAACENKCKFNEARPIGAAGSGRWS